MKGVRDKALAKVTTQGLPSLGDLQPVKRRADHQFRQDVDG